MLFVGEVLLLPFYPGCSFCSLRLAINSMCLDSRIGTMFLWRCYCNKSQKLGRKVELALNALNAKCEVELDLGFQFISYSSVVTPP